MLFGESWIRTMDRLEEYLKGRMRNVGGSMAVKVCEGTLGKKMHAKREAGGHVA